MKNVPLFGLMSLIILPCLAAAQLSDCQPVARYDYYDYALPEGWRIGSRHGFSYDVSGKVQDDTTYLYASRGNYHPFKLQRRTYDASGRITSETQHNFNDALAAFEPSRREEWAYDATGHLRQRMELWWDASPAAWDTFAIVQTSYTFDAHDSILIQQRREGNSLAGPFKPISLKRWKRDAQGRPLELVDSLRPATHLWSKLTWSYPAPTGGYDRHCDLIWDTGTKSWRMDEEQYNIVWFDFDQRKPSSMDVVRHGHPEDSLHVVVENLPEGGTITHELFVDMGQLDSLHRISTYLDRTGNPTLHYTATRYRRSNHTWWSGYPIDSTQYVRGANDCLLERIHHAERPSGPGTFGPAERSVHVYQSNDALPPAKATDLMVDPHPGRGQVGLRWQGGPRDVELVDHRGSVLRQWKGVTPGTVLDVGDMAPGIYYWRSSDASARWILQR